MNLDSTFVKLFEHGGISGMMIAGALLYLALQVRALQHSVDLVQETIGQKVFPKLDDLTDRVSRIEGRIAPDDQR